MIIGEYQETFEIVPDEDPVPKRPPGEGVGMPEQPADEEGVWAS